MTVLRIAYLNEEADLSGGTRVVLAHADALIARGHQVVIVSRGPSPSWISTTAEWKTVTHFSEINASEFDFVIATFWTTIRPAFDLAGKRALHLCQGYEGSFSFYEASRREIEESYSLPVARLVVAAHLETICRRFHLDVTFIGQLVDDRFFRESSGEEHEPLRILATGAQQIDLKGVDDVYGAVLHARSRGWKFDLVRVSPWPPSRVEPHEVVAAEFHVALPASEMVALVHSCDLFISGSHEEEGFGLPAAEAMASMLPTVLTSISSYRSFDEQHDYALFALPSDPVDLGEKLIDLLEDEELRGRLARRGGEVAESFRKEKVAERLEQFLLSRHERVRNEK